MQTLETLEKFIQTQKALLARTQADIERLRELKNQVQATQAIPTADVVDSLIHELGSSAKLSEQLDVAEGPPFETIEWALFSSRDPSALKAFAASSRAAYARNTTPSPHQQSPLSDLQKFVKQARITILDPVLSQYPTEDDDRPPPPASEPRKRRVASACGLTIPVRRYREAVGEEVCVRRDVGDESAEVDVLLDGDENGDMGRSASPPTPILADPPDRNKITSNTTRARRPTMKLQHARAHGRRHEKPETQPPSPSPPPTPDSSTMAVQLGKVRPKSETYKMAWSLEEQHLLERLLEEIPQGEKQRWLKISRAMNGRRTPKQVASRVQKYFEKLKQFGVDVDVSGTGPGGSRAGPKD